MEEIIERIEGDLKRLKVELKGLPKKKTKEPKEEPPVLNEAETLLYAKLKEIRKELAASKDVQLYVICHNSAFYDIIRCMPKNVDELRSYLTKKQAEDHAETLFAKLKALKL